MDKKRLEQFKKKLEERQQELRRVVSRTEQDGRDADSEVAQDIADKAAYSYNKEFLFHQSNSERQILQMVDQHQTPGSRALDTLLHSLPGKTGEGPVGGRNRVEL